MKIDQPIELFDKKNDIGLKSFIFWCIYYLYKKKGKNWIPTDSFNFYLFFTSFAPVLTFSI